MMISYQKMADRCKRIIHELLRKYAEYQQFVWGKEGKSVSLGPMRQSKLNN